MRACASSARKKEKRNNSPSKGIGILIVFTILSLDQLSKFIVSKYLSAGQSVPIVKNILHLTLVHNTGAAFGIFKNQTFVFIIISLIALPAIYFNFKAKAAGQGQDKLTRLALLLVISGAIGNLIDRIAWGYVIDFIDLRIWPVFNAADSAITIGAVLLGYSLLKRK